LEQPGTRYARSGDVNIAYQVWGDGLLDMVFVFGWVSNLEDVWQVPAQTKFFGRLASFSRLILFDKRGTGMSDQVPGIPMLEERMDDVRAVMDAVGSDRAALWGLSEGGPMSLLFAATYPDRVTHLIMSGSYPRMMWAPDFPIGRTREWMERFETIIDHWGEGRSVEYFLPDRADDPEAVAGFARFERLGATPSMARRLMLAVTEIDARDILPTVRVPTLITHREDERPFPVEGAHYMAERIDGAELFIQPGSAHVPWLGGGRELADRVEEFVTGERANRAPDRILSTVMFTDIVDSTGRAADLGDRDWRALLDQHDDIGSRQVDAHRGRLVKTMGDGLFASFDRPAAAVECAVSIRDQMPGVGLEIRAGVHTGEVELRADDLGGIGVHIGARVAALAGPGEVLVSRTVRDLVIGSGLEFEDRGSHELKGVPEKWQLYAVTR
jgi:class 3 adenylate cyclase/pimeloyl-ACP methyl ester carboxylesterase